MKSIKYIIMPVLAGFVFASCNNEVKAPSQADIDAQVEAKVKAAGDQLKADCDTRIQQAAQLKADSIIAKAAGKKVTPAPAPAPAPKKVVTPPTPKHVTPAPPKHVTPPAPHTKPTDVNDRVGGNGNSNASAPKDVNDRKGGNDKKNTAAPKDVNDRPGGN